MKINKRTIGAGNPVYLIAEISGNHNQDFDLAVKTIEAAKTAGADCIKLQTYTADTITINSDAPSFHIKSGTLWDGKTLYELYKGAYTPWEWHERLRDITYKLGMDFFSSAFDATAVDFLDTLNVPIHKVASFEMIDTQLVEKMARTGKPMIISTGMATLIEIAEAVETAQRAGCRELCLLKCTSAYPSPYNEMNLRSIPHLAATFGVPIGLSDHTLGTAVPVAAVSLGASVIEKHFILSRSLKGPDSAFSLEPQEFKSMVESVRAVEQALGSVQYGVSGHQTKSLVFRRSLFVVEDVTEGELFTERNVRSIRPGNGLAPKYLPLVLGRKATCAVSRGTPLDWKMLGEASAKNEAVSSTVRRLRKAG